MQNLRNLPRYKQNWREICAILPIYLPDGTNGTKITYQNGISDYISSRLIWVLDDLLGYLRSSKSILTAQSRQLLGKDARRVPLALCPEFILVPVKGREAIGENDSMLGYIVLHHVKLIASDKNGCCIYFTGGAKLTVYDQLKTLRQNMQIAEEIRRSLAT